MTNKGWRTQGRAPFTSNQTARTFELESKGPLAFRQPNRHNDGEKQRAFSIRCVRE
jgi:hypothetical protein